MKNTQTMPLTQWEAEVLIHTQAYQTQMPDTLQYKMASNISWNTANDIVFGVTNGTWTKVERIESSFIPILLKILSKYPSINTLIVYINSDDSMQVLQEEKRKLDPSLPKVWKGESGMDRFKRLQRLVNAVDLGVNIVFVWAEGETPEEEYQNLKAKVSEINSDLGRKLYHMPLLFKDGYGKGVEIVGRQYFEEAVGIYDDSGYVPDCHKIVEDREIQIEGTNITLIHLEDINTFIMETLFKVDAESADFIEDDPFPD